MSDAAFDALALIAVALIGLVGTVVTVLARRRQEDGEDDMPSVTEQQVRDAEDPGVLALRVALGTQRDLEETRAELSQTRSELSQTREDLSAANVRLDVLAEQNRRLRKVLRGVVVRLEGIAEWVRAGHHPPPPFTPEEIMEYISGQVPDLHEEEDGA